MRFLPGFDNIILAHANRRRIIADAHRSRVTTKDLQVLPTFLVDGFAAGTWKASRTRKTADLALTPFVPVPNAARKALLDEGEKLCRFLEPESGSNEVRFEQP